MKLENLLEITAMDQVVNIIAYKDRKKIKVKTIKYKNDSGRIESWKYDEFIKEHGEKTVTCQYIEDDKLIVVIELS